MFRGGTTGTHRWPRTSGPWSGSNCGCGWRLTTRSFQPHAPGRTATRRSDRSPPAGARESSSSVHGCWSRSHGLFIRSRSPVAVGSPAGATSRGVRAQEACPMGAATEVDRPYFIRWRSCGSFEAASAVSANNAAERRTLVVFIKHLRTLRAATRNTAPNHCLPRACGSRWVRRWPIGGVDEAADSDGPAQAAEGPGTTRELAQWLGGAGLRCADRFSVDDGGSLHNHRHRFHVGAARLPAVARVPARPRRAAGVGKRGRTHHRAEQQVATTRKWP
jgi:hypothetical protein